MAPVTRASSRTAAPSRRPSTPPAQQRRNAAAAPTRREAAEEPEATAFDAGADEAEDQDEDAQYTDADDLPQVIDLSGVQAATYEVIPRGVYEGYIDSVEYTLSQSSNQPMLVWILKFEYEDKERTLRFYTTLGGDGAGRTKATLAKLDPELDLSQFVPDDADEIFGGMEVNIRVTIRPDRDDRKIKRNNVADIWPLDED